MVSPIETAPVGTAVRFTGTDVVRIADALIVEYWVNTDIQVCMPSWVSRIRSGSPHEFAADGRH